jgi:hypothetical protein
VTMLRSSISWNSMYGTCGPRDMASLVINRHIHFLPRHHDPVSWKYHKVESKVAPWKRSVESPDNVLRIIKGNEGITLNGFAR